MAGAADSQRIVLIAVDASEHSKRAFNYYTSRVSMENDRVIICHVPEQPNLPVFSAKDGLNIPVEEWRKTMQDTMERVHALEKEYEAEMVQRKIHYQTISESAKSPGVGIIESARKVNASLIIMGSRGLDAVRRTFMGSVSEYVLHHSGVPVLIVPPVK